MINELERELIIKQSKQIETHLDKFSEENCDVELVCVDIINKLRTFVEHIAAYHYGMVNNVEWVLSKSNLRETTTFMKNPNQRLSFLKELHDYLQSGSSHYVIDEISAPRLLWKYIPYLLRTRNWLKQTYNIDVLTNLKKANSIHSNYLSDYYKEIYKAVCSAESNNQIANDRYYVHKSIPIIVGDDVIYETTVGIASDYSSKFNHFIVFSRFKIEQKYAVKLNCVNCVIRIDGLSIPIKIALNYIVSIRPCEFTNLGKLVSVNIDVKSHLNEYKYLMEYITENHKGLHDIVLADPKLFKEIKNKILRKTEKPVIFVLVERLRSIINDEKYGSNVLKYLLVIMNNKVIKNQYSKEPNYHMLNIKQQPFDSLPIAMSLKRHNTNLLDLIEVFDLDKREDELFYRKINNKTNQKGILYHSLSDLNVDKSKALNLMNSINGKLDWNSELKIVNTGDLFCIKQYETITENIFNKLDDLSSRSFANFKMYVQNEINRLSYNIDSEEKRKIALSLLENTAVACIFGPAGTGKSTMAKHISFLFQNSTKKYLSNTNPAVMNMYRKIGGSKNDFMTIKKFLNNPVNCDFLFIDECSMVSNMDFCKILNCGNFKYLILLGDVYQIQSIDFGSWFKFANHLICSAANNELTELHRTSKPDLKIFWEAVRNKAATIDEILSSYSYTRELNDVSLFNINDDQIILCLSYGGLYGINNLNLIMQERNPRTGFTVGNITYKIGDPILFLDNNKYSAVLYNNLKGHIVKVEEYDNFVYFILNVDTNISELDIQEYSGEITVIGNNPDGTTNIRLYVDKEFDSDRDETSSKLIPFQVAYAISIHKAQGLEYEEVKIVIDEGCDEMISHDIFYTAITRATKKLSIYWTLSTQQKVLKNITNDESKKDISVFASKHHRKIRR